MLLKIAKLVEGVLNRGAAATEREQQVVDAACRVTRDELARLFAPELSQSAFCR